MEYRLKSRVKILQGGQVISQGDIGLVGTIECGIAMSRAVNGLISGGIVVGQKGFMPAWRCQRCNRISGEAVNPAGTEIKGMPCHWSVLRRPPTTDCDSNTVGRWRGMGYSSVLQLAWLHANATVDSDALTVDVGVLDDKGGRMGDFLRPPQALWV